MTTATHVHSVPTEPRPVACETVSALPHPRLRPYVMGYSGFHSVNDVRHRMLPLNLAVLVLDLTGGSRLVTGPRAVATTEGETTWRHGVCIGLTPAGALALLNVPMPELVGRNARLADVLGERREAELAERLALAPTWQERFELLDDVLTPKREPDSFVMRAWHRLQQPAHRVRIGELAEQMGVSRRLLQTRFQRDVGLSPKTVARIARFQRSVFQLTRSKGLPDIAAECGYADQAHFQREMRAMAGLTPTELCALIQYRELALR